MHTYQSYRTKKAFRESATGKHYSDHLLEVSLFGLEAGPGKQVTVEGPNEYHRWYAQVTIDDTGTITKIK